MNAVATPSSGGPLWLTDALSTLTPTIGQGMRPPAADQNGRAGVDPRTMGLTPAQWTQSNHMGGAAYRNPDGSITMGTDRAPSTFDNIMSYIGMAGGALGLAAVGGAGLGFGDLGAAGAVGGTLPVTGPGATSAADLMASTAYAGGVTDTGVALGAGGSAAGAIGDLGAFTTTAGSLGGGLTVGQGLTAAGLGGAAAGGMNSLSTMNMPSSPTGSYANQFTAPAPAQSWLQQFATNYPNLSKYGPGLLSGAMSLYSGYQQNQAAQAAIKASDPFGPYRAQYAQQLSTLMAHPGTVTQLPGYQYGMDQAMQATDRQMAAGGFLGSGNEALALQNTGLGYATQTYNDQVKTLAGLAGANVVPNATGAGLNAMGSGAQQTQAGFGQLAALYQMYTQPAPVAPAATTSPFAGIS